MALLLIQERWKNKMKVIIVGGVAEELQLQQGYADWMNMQKLLYLKNLDTYPMRIVGFHIILET